MLKGSAVWGLTRFDYAQHLKENIPDSALCSIYAKWQILRETGRLCAFYYFHAEKLLCKGNMIWLNITADIELCSQHQFLKMRVPLLEQKKKKM